MIRPLRPDEIDAALAIINRAALAYKGVIPPDCWQESYMVYQKFPSVSIDHGVMEKSKYQELKKLSKGIMQCARISLLLLIQLDTY